MECPKCKKETCVLVTKDDKKRKTDRRGLFWMIITAPFRFIGWLWRLLFGKRQKYEKKTYWHCNYCGKDFSEKGEE